MFTQFHASVVSVPLYAGIVTQAPHFLHTPNSVSVPLYAGIVTAFTVAEDEYNRVSVPLYAGIVTLKAATLYRIDAFQFPCMRGLLQ